MSNTYIVYTLSQQITVKNCASEEEALTKLEELGIRKDTVFKIEQQKEDEVQQND